MMWAIPVQLFLPGRQKLPDKGCRRRLAPGNPEMPLAEHVGLEGQQQFQGAPVEGGILTT
jgi:hypothetical protein